MPARLQCPACSAPLDAPANHGATLRCPYCGTSALLTERSGAMEAAGGQPETIAEVVRLLRAGRKIEAVKLYRERFGVGLKEAKDAVDRIAAGQPAGTIPGGTGAKWAFGCLTALALAAVGAVAMLATRPGPDPADADPPPAERAVAAPAPQPPPGPPPFAEQVLAWGSEGTGAGRFEDARNVAVDAAGRVYVAEYSGGRVQVFDTLGTFLTQWTADPKMPLVDLEADRGGTVFVVQSGAIRRYEGATGKPLGAVPNPEGRTYSDIALALDGSIWGAVWPHGIVHVGADGGERRSIDAREAIGESASPARVAVAGTGDLYVLDQWSGEIYHLDPAGRFVDRFGGKGGGAGSLSSPTDLAIDGRGRVYVSDLGRGVRVFTPGGELLDSIGSGVVFGIAFTDRDELFAAYRNQNQVVKFRLRE